MTIERHVGSGGHRGDAWYRQLMKGSRVLRAKGIPQRVEQLSVVQSLEVR